MDLRWCFLRPELAQCGWQDSKIQLPAKKLTFGRSQFISACFIYSHRFDQFNFFLTSPASSFRFFFFLFLNPFEHEVACDMKIESDLYLWCNDLWFALVWLVVHWMLNIQNQSVLRRYGEYRWGAGLPSPTAVHDLLVFTADVPAILCYSLVWCVCDVLLWYDVFVTCYSLVWCVFDVLLSGMMCLWRVTLWYEMFVMCYSLVWCVIWVWCVTRC